jgi:membrane protease YdiL (CAAX protease family)
MNTPKKIVVFLALTFALSSIFYYLIITTKSFPTSYALGIMWCPGLAAVITQLIFHRSLRGLGWKPGRGRYLLASYALPLAYVLTVYVLVWLLGLGRFDAARLEWALRAANGPSSAPFSALSSYLAITLTFGFMINCFAALGEEIGWRGLLVPELAKSLTFTKTALISGGIWAIWHWPTILSGEYNNAGIPLWFGMLCFTVMVIGISFPFAWLRLQSGSLWGAVLMHAAHNLFIQAIFTPLTADTGITEYVIDEFGIGLALIAPVLVYVFWRRRHEVETTTASIQAQGSPIFAPAK